MSESVKSSGLVLDMPVIEEIIMKECASYQAVLIYVYLKCPLKEISHKETIFRDCHAVLENSSLAMLYVILHISAGK